MIKNIVNNALSKTGMKTGKIRVGVAVLKVEKTASSEVRLVTDIHNNEIKQLKYKGEYYDIVTMSSKPDKENKVYYFIRVNKEDEPNSFPMSVPYFVLNPELEAIYGKRATMIKIMFVGDIIYNEKDKSFDVEQVIETGHCKFSGGALECYGDEEQGHRFDQKTQKYINTQCLCAYSRYFKQTLELKAMYNKTSKTLHDMNGNLLQGRIVKDLPQVYYENAWRRLENPDVFQNDGEIILKFKNEKEDMPCEVRYILKFITPQTKGINLITFEGSGKNNAESLILSMIQIFKLFKTLSGIPLYLKVKMETKKSKGNILTRKFPVVYLHLDRSVDEMIEARMTKQLQIESKQIDPIELIGVSDEEEIEEQLN